MIDIHIIPIKKLYSFLEETTIDNSVAVIASSEEIDSQKIPIPYIVEYCDDDIDCEIYGGSITLEQASRCAHFVTGLDNSVSHIYCCCQSAQSRSATVASALYKYYGDSTLAYSVWKNPIYSPNPYVFLLLCEALGVSFEYVEFDALIEANRQAIR